MTYLPIDCDPPTKKEIYQAINQLKNGKSAGQDSSRTRQYPSRGIENGYRNYSTLSSRSGKRDKSHQNGRKAISSDFQRRVTSALVPATYELNYCPSKVISRELLGRMSSIGWKMQLTLILRTSGRLPQGQVPHKLDCVTAQHPRTVTRMELPSPRQLYWLLEDIWLPGPTDPLETAETQRRKSPASLKTLIVEWHAEWSVVASWQMPLT